MTDSETGFLDEPEELAPPSGLPLAPNVRTFRAWLTYRRIILATVLAIASWAFLRWLPDDTQRAIFRGLFAQRNVVISLLVVLALTLSLVWSAGQRLDAWIFLLFNVRGPRPHWLDNFMWLATQLGSGLTSLVVAIVVSAQGYRRLALEVVLGTLTLWLLVEIIKAFAERSRPFTAYSVTRIVGWRARGMSFPSGHTAQAFFIVSVLVHHFELGLRGSVPLYGAAGLVALTRMYVGAHYPRDVIAGGLLGFVWGILAVLVDPWL